MCGGICAVPANAQDSGRGEDTAWPAGIFYSDSSPVDLSSLNAPERPAGRHGFLKARGDKLLFADGTVARLWGTNLTAHSLFDTPADKVREHAHRISELGFNLVRIHHQDSEWVVPNIFGGRDARSTRELDPAMLERLDWWIKCLKDEGIYLWLDLHVGRNLKAADGVEGFAEISQGRPTTSLKGYNYVNSSIRELMKQFNDAYLTHQNRFTGLRYKDDPAIAALLLTNENDLTNHYGNALLPDRHVPQHTAIYLREAEDFAARYMLPNDLVWRSWEGGPAKLFLNDLERRFDVNMIDQLRNLGVKTPIATTSTWGLNPLSSLPALTAGDVVDVHAYGGAGELGKNPLVSATLVNWIAAAQVVGKPLTVTEWGIDDHGAAAPDRQNIPLYVAASASLQDWDAVMFYAYSYEALTDGGGTASPYQAYNDRVLMAEPSRSAVLFRQGHVKAANTTYVFAPTKQMLFDQPLSAANSAALRTASERGKLLIALPQVSRVALAREERRFHRERPSSAIRNNLKFQSTLRKSSPIPVNSTAIGIKGHLQSIHRAPRRPWVASAARRSTLPTSRLDVTA